MNVGIIDNSNSSSRILGSCNNDFVNCQKINTADLSSRLIGRNHGALYSTTKKHKKAKSEHKATPKPKAGSTSVKLKNASDFAVDKDGNPLAGWREVDPSTIQVRGTGYSSLWKKKSKVNSPGDLYRCVKADVFESQRRYPDMASRVRLPRIKFDDEDERGDEEV